MLNEQELIRTAREAIGKGEAADWKIAPVEHAVMFAAVAPSLAVCLGGARQAILAESYEDLNLRAVRAQALFKQTARKADLAVFATASLGALLLVTGGLDALQERFGAWPVRSIGILGIITSGLATMWLSQLRGGGLAKQWAEARARAEAKRLAYFKSVVEDITSAPLDRLLAFEYVRRFLLDNQIDYFRERGGKHESSAHQTLTGSSRALFLASTFTAVAGALSLLSSKLALVASLGVIASAYAALTLSRSAMNQDRTNADRYLVAATRLRELKAEIDKYRSRIAVGDSAATQEFFQPVFEVLTADHNQFLIEAEKRELAIGSIASRLDAASTTNEKLIK
ncbi:MAG: hypothetical protein ACOYLN_10505 [Blastocatellia bacterium]|jgi:hypothetical protein